MTPDGWFLSLSSLSNIPPSSRLRVEVDDGDMVRMGIEQSPVHIRAFTMVAKCAAQVCFLLHCDCAASKQEFKLATKARRIANRTTAPQQ